MHKIVIQKDGEKSVLDILLEKKYFVDNPCNGKGICGKCKIRVTDGDAGVLTETEKECLTEEEIRDGIRLSCMLVPVTQLEVQLLKEEKKQVVLTSGYMPSFEREEGAVDTYGVAVDLGTTTVALSLVELWTGRVVAECASVNAQKQYGMDVLTRITYEMEHPDTGVKQLQEAIVQSFQEMILKMCQEVQISKEQIREMVVAANCTMLHMFRGVTAVSLGRAPYQPVFTKSQQIQAKDLGFQLGENTKVYLLPSVSAYIGADIVAGAYVCALQKEKRNVLFIDIGTNGEIVLSHKGKLLTCSCAAGPALEGMNIRDGMRAAAGAIEDVWITEEGVKLQVIGKKEPQGICGSGILAVVRELLRHHLIRPDGAFIKTKQLEEGDYRLSMLELDGRKRLFCLNDKLRITQGDVRQVQLAKGAILSGFYALLHKAGLDMRDLDQVVIAGQFGAHLPVESLVETGILPEEVKEKIIYVGNTSKMGAYMALLSKKVKVEMEELALHMDYMELAETENYERLFADCLMFPK